MKMKSKLEKFTPILVGTCLLALVAACGSDDDDNDSGAQGQQREQQQEGEFRVVFTPVNANVAGGVSGTANFSLLGDDFQTQVDVTGAPSAIHMQHVHAGRACPTGAADRNGDGYIDAVEASAVTGGSLIPLDTDLRSQTAGGSYPVGRRINYSESTSFLAMLGDLRLPDTNTNDLEVKLGATDDLDLEGRVVEIHGVPSSTTLPATVRGAGGLSPQQTLPIACGVITRVDTGTTTGGTGTTTGGTGTTTGGTGTTTGGTGTTTGSTGTTTGSTGTTTGTTGTATTGV